jgi:hypothetical protein
MTCKILDECPTADTKCNPDTCLPEPIKGLSDVVAEYRPDERVIERPIVQLLNECE